MIGVVHSFVNLTLTSLPITFEPLEFRTFVLLVQLCNSALIVVFS